MEKYDVSQLLPEDGGCRVCKYIRQRWQNESFSYRDEPRPDTGILFVTRGQILFLSEEGELSAKAGSIVLLSKGSHYEAVVRPEFGQTEDYLINFDTDLPTQPSPPMLLTTSADGWYVDFFETIMERSLRGEDSTLWIKGQLYLLLDRLQSTNRQDPEKERLLRRVRELLTDDRDLPVRQIAKLCGVSESGLRAIFTAAYGCSPLQYRMNSKISRAKYLLESTDLSVYDIAEQLRFYDEAYFCKMFRKHTGCSPKKYLQNKSI